MFVNGAAQATKVKSVRTPAIRQSSMQEETFTDDQGMKKDDQASHEHCKASE
jgi:hypothetical protein